MLSIKNISKNYGDTEALKGLSLKIDNGDIYGLLGPNGSGKTTTIRIILSIIFPDSGEVEMDFERVGYLPEERGLYPNMRIDELIYFFGELRGMERPLIKEKMQFWLEKLELKERIEDEVQSLSKGLKQRLHLLISVLHDPDFLILDEPFTGLDPIAIKGLRDLINELRNRGKTVLLSTHWMDQAEQLCDKVCLIKEGEKIYEGGLKDLKDSHRKEEIYLELLDPSVLEDTEILTILKEKDNGFIVKPGKPHGELLRELSSSTEVLEFRILAPDLEEIFIEEVSGE